MGLRDPGELPLHAYLQRLYLLGMGMSDYISCDSPLPDRLDGRQYEFQIFDFGNQYYIYLISKDGDLFLILDSNNG